MIGKNIKTVIDASGMSYSQVADMLDITYQYLFKIFNKDSVETRYLFEIAKILNIPVVKFFEGEPGAISPVINVNDLQLKIEKLTKRVNELDEQLEDKRNIIKYQSKEIDELMKFYPKEDIPWIHHNIKYNDIISQIDNEFPKLRLRMKAIREEKKHSYWRDKEYQGLLEQWGNLYRERIIQNEELRELINDALRLETERD